TVAALPLQEIAQSVLGTVEEARRVLRSPEIDRSLKSLDAALVDARGLIRRVDTLAENVNAQVGPLSADRQAPLQSAPAAPRDAPGALKGRPGAARGAAGARAGCPPRRGENRRTRRSAAHVAGEDVEHVWRHAGARAGNPGRRRRDAQSGLRARLRARPDDDRASRERTGPGIPSRFSGAEPGRAALRRPPDRSQQPMK